MRYVRGIFGGRAGCFRMIVILALLCVLHPYPVFGEEKQTDLVYLDTQRDLEILFQFDKKAVDIGFISPSGQKKTAADADVEYEQGDLWRAYRIQNAEQGQWKAVYDLGENSQISYSVIQSEGIWIQYVRLEKGEEKSSLIFRTDYAAGDDVYQYEIYAFSKVQEPVRLAEGNAQANREITVPLELARLPEGEYRLRLDVFYRGGGMEVFDSMQTDAFSYTPNNLPQGVRDFQVQINQDENTCALSWEKTEGANRYLLVVHDGQKEIYRNQTEDNTAVFQFEADAKRMKITLSALVNQGWTAGVVKEINLTEEGLWSLSKEITAAASLDLKFKTNKQSRVLVLLNGEKKEYKVSGEHTLTLPLNEGVNTVFAELFSDNSVSYIVNQKVLYDHTHPEIWLFEDWDGKVVHTKKLTVSGKVTGSSILKLDGKTVSLSEDGIFSEQVHLRRGENVILLQTEDQNQNLTERKMVVYFGSRKQNGAFPYLILLIALMESLLIGLFAVCFLKKRENTDLGEAANAQMLRGRSFFKIRIGIDLILCALDGFLIWNYIHYIRFNRSMEFVALSESSLSKAYESLQNEKRFGISAVCVFILLIVLVVLEIWTFKKRQDDEPPKG